MDWDFMYIYAKKELKLSDEEYFTMSLGRFFDLCDTMNEINDPSKSDAEDIIVEDDNAKRSALKAMIG